MGVQTQVDGAAYDRAGSFGGLPDSKIECAVARGWVTNDDGSLSSPEETCTDAAESAAEKHEPGVCADVVGVQASTVQRVANGTKRESVVQSNAVVDGTCKHTDNGE